MDNSDSSTDFKKILSSYILLIALCIFVVIYLIINYDKVKAGDIYSGDLTKSILLTGIITLLIYMFATWDDDSMELSEKDGVQKNKVLEIEVPKYKLGGAIPQSGIQTIEPVIQSIQPIQPMNSIKLVQPVQTGQSVQSGQYGQLVQPIQLVQAVQPVQSVQAVQPVQLVQSMEPIVGSNAKGSLGGFNNRTGTNPVVVPPSNSLGLTNFNIFNKVDNPAMSNPNIFVSKKNINKYGIKF